MGKTGAQSDGEDVIKLGVIIKVLQQTGPHGWIWQVYEVVCSSGEL